MKELMTSLIIHGHFYQPPRENPWTGVVDREPGAEPFHDWNERIHAECYRPNSEARIIIDAEERLVNNCAYLSFDFGPTLLSWLAQNHPETYARILEADAENVRKNDGHGNAIAQGYNHAILPLCNERDRLTQVRWGLADFRYRFGREAESMWLPETACNDAVLGVLIDEGVKFVILAPQQASRVRNASNHSGNEERPANFTEAKWQNVSAATIDTTVPYRSRHRDGSGRSLAVFFYDPQLAHAIAFEQALSSSSLLVEQFARRSAGPGALVNVATDGESYGHHHKFGELCLAYAIALDAPARGFLFTNYGHHLEQNPPRLEVEISNGPSGEGSSWSCVHGVGRWLRDCGCHTGGGAGWNQLWRGPLRSALDYLRDQAVELFEGTRGELFVDPWDARDAAISLVLDPLHSRERFLNEHAPRGLTREEQLRALAHLELQRNALLMYTSCGWFFSDISGIEPIQILKYAGRAIELMNELGAEPVRARFLEILAEAESNRTELGNGADIYRRFVEPSNPSYQKGNEEFASTFA
jgi:alpha-amylase/alpha-mannosidase (GH57 family)